MSAAVQLPEWALYVIGFGTPSLTFAGVLLAQWIGRKGATELETRSRREETLRVLRWAAELAVADDEGKAKLGVSQLNALADSDLLDESQLLFVDAALNAVIVGPEDEIENAGDDVDVQLQRPRSNEPDALGPVSSGGQAGSEGSDGE